MKEPTRLYGAGLTARLSIKITPDERSMVVECAQVRGVSLNQFIRRCRAAIFLPIATQYRISRSRSVIKELISVFIM